MNKEKILKTINNINSILFLLLIIVLLIIIISFFISTQLFKTRSSNNVIEVTSTDENPLDEDEIEYQLGYLRNIYGSDTYILELKTIDTTNKLSYGGQSSMIKNILFVEGADFESHWLFQSNNQIIKNYNQWRLTDEDSSEPGDTYQISMSVIKYDTNNDGKVTLKDGLTKIMVDPFGNELTELGVGTRFIFEPVRA